MSTPSGLPALVLTDTITKLPPSVQGAVVVAGSHAGLYPGYLVAKAGLRAVVLNDAGIGRESAGIASLAYLEPLGIAAVALSSASCRIGDVADMLARGIVGHANRPAAACGIGPGQACREAAERLRSAPGPSGPVDPAPVGEGRSEVAGAGHRRVSLLDSAAMVTPSDAGTIVVTGSHGGLLGGDPARALAVDAFAVAFNDAGIGPDEAGTTRLPALDRRGIAAVTVSAASARIGDGRSTFEDGIVSRANGTARRMGAMAGEPARALILRWAALPLSA